MLHQNPHRRPASGLFYDDHEDHVINPHEKIKIISSRLLLCEVGYQAGQHELLSESLGNIVRFCFGDENVDILPQTVN